MRAAWGLEICDGFGQTETTAMVGNPPGLPVRPGSIGKPLPGNPVLLLDPSGTPGDDGEICIDLARRPVSLMQGYADDVFKASGCRTSPFELESALIEHPAVAEAAVVPSRGSRPSPPSRPS